MKSPLSQYFLVMRRFAGWISLSLLLGIATIGAGIGLLGTSAYLIASAALQPSIAELQVAIVGVRFFGLSRAVFRYLERLVSHSVNLRILSKLRGDVYRGLEPGAPANLQTLKSGDLLERVIGDLETLENFYVRVFAPGIIAMIVTLGMGLFVGGYSLEIGLILGSGLLFNGFIIPGLSLWLTDRANRSISTHTSRLSSLLVEFLQGMEDLVTNGVEETWLRRMEEENRILKNSQLTLNRQSASFTALNVLVMNLTILGAILIAIPLVATGDLSGVSLAVILLLVGASFEATTSMPQAAKNWTASREAARRLFEFSTKGDRTVSIANSERFENTAILKMNNVTFRYPGEDLNVLENIQLDLQSGQSKAVIGLSGSGKTTLFDLLLRFWEPTAGDICINGKISSEIDADHWRRYFGVIGQSVYLFNTTLRENLLLADPAASDSRQVDAMHEAGLGDWFQGLPQGLDTWVGEHGLRLSAGERQRVAIVRILLTDPDFVLLDEPTANLDAINEQELLKTLKDVFLGKGTLLITHRLDLLQDLDEVIVLDQGKIVEHGNPIELDSKIGLFHKMNSIQRDMLEFRRFD